MRGLRAFSGRALVAHPSAELYGSDRVALESVGALVEAGCEVHTTLTTDGPLRGHLERAGSAVSVVATPVLRKALLSPGGLLRFVGETARRTPEMFRLLRRLRPDLVYVSTVTVPWWLFLARLSGARVVCHVHEAEQSVPRIVRTALAAPLLLAHVVIANSELSRSVVVDDLPWLRRRTSVIYNGVPGPDRAAPARETLTGAVRLVLVGRISPRKGTDVAVSALQLLTERGVDAVLDLVGGVFPGYEWFEREVKELAERSGVADRVRWLGVCSDVWAALADADVVLVPSRVEPFGNAAVEGMLADRPVVVGDTQGLREIVRHEDNGMLAAAGDAVSLADAITAVIADWDTARERAARARVEAAERFGARRYREALLVGLR